MGCAVHDELVLFPANVTKAARAVQRRGRIDAQTKAERAAMVSSSSNSKEPAIRRANNTQAVGQHTSWRWQAAAGVACRMMVRGKSNRERVMTDRVGAVGCS